MPYRCSTCDHLSRTEFNEDCKDKLKCQFQRVETIHWMNAEGEGRLIATKQVVATNRQEVPIAQQLFLNCITDNPSPIATPYRPAVTCMDCLSVTPTPEPTPTPLPTEE